MNFLALVKRLQREAGLSGMTPVAAVTGQTGMAQKLVDWINTAWVEIQEMRGGDWMFMRGEHSHALTIGDNEYDLVVDWGWTDVRRFDPKDWRIEELTTDRSPLVFLPYARWREQYGHAAFTTPGRPSMLTSHLPNQLRFNALPDKAYVVTAGYWKVATELVANTDTPSLPTDHMAIVWKALEHYAYHEGSPELLATAKAQWKLQYAQIIATQLPPVEVDPCPIA